MNTSRASDASAADRETIEFRAAEWCDALREGGDDPRLRRAFEQWRAADPAHAEAFERIDRAYRLALAAGGSRPMVELESEVLEETDARERRRGRRYAAGAAAATGLIAVILTGFVATGGSWQELEYLRDRTVHALAGETLYRTGIGQRLSVVLRDGSELTLNTDSRAVVRYDETGRRVALVRGQALFEVAKDSARPFVVRAGDRRVTALGTAFDVRLSKRRLEVTLLEGRIAVEALEPAAPGAGDDEAAPARANAHLPAHVLEPGEQLVVAVADPLRAAAPSPEPVIRNADAKRATSWRHGQIIFEDDRLADAVDEINRYGGRRVVLADESLGDLRVSGIFNIGANTVFVETLMRYFPLRIVEANEDRIVLDGRNSG